MVTLAAGSWLWRTWAARADPAASGTDGTQGVVGQLYGEAPPAAGFTDTMVIALQARLRQRPDDARSYTLLGAAYLQKARETGDPTYYAKADQVLQEALIRTPQDSDTLIALGTLALARHQFSQALALGQQASGINPYSARALGVIVDAQVELGDYEAAAATAQAMVDLRPDLASFARAAYIRELRGDVTGALEAMQRAAQAGSGVPENAAWTLTQQGLLQFNQGDLEAAQASFDAALRAVPGYGPAQAGLARLAAARGHWDAAIATYEKLAAAMPLAEYVIALGDCYQAVGRTADAEQQYALVSVLIELQRANGVDTDLELTLFEADHPERVESLAATVARARQVYERRPTLYASDALAWTLYQAGQYEEAQAYAEQALRWNTQDALLWFHAGMIELAAGDGVAARARLETALAINPHFSLLWSPVAQETLANLPEA
jgi:tetratricopeptide (TPR) repeat protein